MSAIKGPFNAASSIDELIISLIECIKEIYEKICFRLATREYIAWSWI